MHVISRSTATSYYPTIIMLISAPDSTSPHRLRKDLLKLISGEKLSLSLTTTSQQLRHICRCLSSLLFSSYFSLLSSSPSLSSSKLSFIIITLLFSPSSPSLSLFTPSHLSAISQSSIQLSHRTISYFQLGEVTIVLLH